MVNREVVAYSKSCVFPKKEVTIETMESFHWEDAAKELQAGVPLLWKVFEAVICKKDSKNPQAVCNSIMSSLQLRFPQSMKFYARWNSLHLFKHGNCHAVHIFPELNLMIDHPYT